jgi:hypothetical protein
VLAAGCLVVAAVVWALCLRFVYRPAEAAVRPEGGLSPHARSLLTRQLALWGPGGEGGRERSRMRASNPEWDFMGRTYLVLALANAALRDVSLEARCLAAIDRVIDDTLTAERDHGSYWFLMGYARARPWVYREGQSVFVDGEVAMMIAARRLVRESPRLRDEQRVRALRIAAQMRAGPILSAESYPDECWTFCNTVALAALRLGDGLDGTDHRPLAAAWVAAARSRLVDARTGLLVSSYTLDGRVKDGPEGSSIYMVAHDLLLIDPAFARDQYARARHWLGGDALGFGYAREWPRDAPAHEDIDSGPTVPLLDANAGASGMALLGAGAFDDRATLAGLMASLELAAFPIEDGSGLRYAASNAVGDAVLLYALVEGPLWQRARGRMGP